MQEKIYGGDVRIGSDADPVFALKSPPPTAIPEGDAVDVDIAAPKQSAPAEYTEQRIPERLKGVETEKTEKEVPKLEESVDISEKSGIIEEKVEETAETDVHKVGNINLDIYKCITDDIQTDEVVITDSQIDHIKERHPNDYERFGMYFKEIVENPDYIIEANKPNTALILKEITENGEKFKTVLRLVTSTDNPEYKNSIITFMKIDEKDWKRILKNKKVLYKSE
ncbi:MAG: PBECR2 nuclease fold domain-containing protein [Ruminococcus sp.]|nr:PBECR2 nuclease fold domain-containing protein [Ruminococcus sp.]